MPARTVVIIGPDAGQVLDRFDGLIADLTRRGQHVAVAASTVDAATGQIAADRDIALAEIPFDILKPRSLSDRNAVRALSQVLSEWRAHAVLGWGGKAAALAALAGRRADVARTVMFMDGLADAVGSGDPSWAWRWLLRPALGAATTLVTTTAPDRHLLARRGLATVATPVLALPPASVRLDRTAVMPLPGSHPLTLLALCGNEAAGGATTLVEALASLPAEQRPAVVLAGPAVEDPGAVPRDRLAASGVSFTSDTLIDTATALARSHAVIDLSPRAGNPVGLARALACGRPIIASDVPGNRELVDAKVNGLLFDPADAASLAIALRSFTRRAELLPAMARAARAKAERRLDSRDVDGRIIAELGLA